MNTRPFFRRTFLPAMLSLLIGFLTMPALNVVRVDARGMGTEHASPWRARANGLAGAALSLLATALASIGRWHRRFERMSRHPLFKPMVAVAALALVALVDHKALFAAPIIFGATATEGQHAGEFVLEERMSAGRPSRENITVLSGQNLKAGAVIGRISRGVGRVSTPIVVGTGNGTVSQVFAGPEVEVGNYVLTCTAAVANGGVFSLTTPSGKAMVPLTMTPGAGGTTVYTSRHINFSITDGGTDFAANDAFTFVVSTTAPVVIGTGNGTVSAISLGPDAKTGNYRVECIAAITNSGTFKIVNPSGETVAVGTIVAGAGGTLVLANQRQLNITITDGGTDFAVGDAFNVAAFNNLSGGKAVAWDPLNFDGRNVAVGGLYDNVDASSADTAGVIVTRDAAFDRSALQYTAGLSAADKASAENDLGRRNIIVR